MNRILVIDDEESVCWAFRDLLQEEGFEVEDASSAEEGLEKAAAFEPDLIILDVRLPGMDGISALPLFRERFPDCPVIVITAHGTTQTAIEAIRLGAVDYLLKPIDDIETVMKVIHKGLKHVRHDEEVEKYYRELSHRAHLEVMVGCSPAMQEVFKQIGAVSRGDVTVLLSGESGTGKELCARLIHNNSGRSGKPFVMVNCASLPETLLESELFGHEKGSFTGAFREKKGYFEIADGGTLFLDEIGDFPPLTQVKLLNFLETRTFERVGGTRPINVDVRVIAATNRNLLELVENGEFRKDLYYRLNVVEISLPPLRERKEDIPILTAYFLLNLERKTGKRVVMSSEAMEVLKRHDFPGNVRELRNAIERAWFLCEGDVILPEHLPPQVRTGRTGAGLSVEGMVEGICESLYKPGETEDMYDRVMDTFEKPLIAWALRTTNGNQVQASRILGINRSTLRKLIVKYSLK